jgi:hypothetical protein
MPLEQLPALDRTSASFKIELDAYFLTELPAFSVGVEALRLEVVANQAAASTAASTATTQAELATTNGAAQVALATTQAENADASASTAITEAGNAAGSASTAAAQAELATTNGAAQVALATTQAENASASESVATSQAGIATDKASEANASALAAAASASSIEGGPVSSVRGMTGLVLSDTSDGIPGLTGFQLNLKNAAGTITSWFTTAATAARTWAMPNKDGTVALTSDITGVNSGTNTGDQDLSELATKTGAETLTNKTLTAPTINGVTGVIDLNTGAAVASAATVNLNTATGNRVHITGTTTITAVTLTRGPRTVIFDGSLTLTHHATNNNLPGAANIVTAAGDRATYESDGTTVYCTSYNRAGAASGGGALVYLSTVTAAGAASADIETGFSATYDEYLLIATGVRSAGNVSMLMRLKMGGAYLETGSPYVSHCDVSSWGSTAYAGIIGATAYVQIGGTNQLYADATAVVAFELRLHDANSARYKNFTTKGWNAYHGTKLDCGGHVANTGVVSGIRIYPSSGTITGTFRLYGIKKA